MKTGRPDWDSRFTLGINQPLDEPIFILRAQDFTAMATIQFWISLQRDAFIKSYASAQLEAFKKWSVKKEADIPDFMMEMVENPVFPVFQQAENRRAAEDLEVIPSPAIEEEDIPKVDNNPHNEIEENISITDDTLKNLDEVFESAPGPMYYDEAVADLFSKLAENDNLNNSDFISKVED